MSLSILFVFLCLSVCVALKLRGWSGAITVAQGRIRHRNLWQHGSAGARGRWRFTRYQRQNRWGRGGRRGGWRWVRGRGLCRCRYGWAGSDVLWAAGGGWGWSWWGRGGGLSGRVGGGGGDSLLVVSTQEHRALKSITRSRTSLNIQGTSTQCPVNSHSAGGIYGNSSAARGRGAGDTFIPIFSRLSGQGSPCHVHSTVHQRGKAKQRVQQQLFPRRVYQCNPSTYTGYD